VKESGMLMIDNLIWICENLTHDNNRVLNLEPDDFSNIVCIYKTLIKGLDSQNNFKDQSSNEILAKITLSLNNLACDANNE
jgi:hypothetical protein